MIPLDKSIGRGLDRQKNYLASFLKRADNILGENAYSISPDLVLEAPK
jgi:hypothetical protein